MELAGSSVYLACKTRDSIIIQIQGEANYQNAGVLDEFLKNTLQLNYKKYCFFFEKCMQIDSTCLGILAGLLLQLKKVDGVCLFCGLQERQLSVIKMLGLDKLAHIVPTSAPEENCKEQLQPLASEEGGSSPELILQAHRFLMEIESRNKIHFQSVISLLEKDISG